MPAAESQPIDQGVVGGGELAVLGGTLSVSLGLGALGKARRGLLFFISEGGGIGLAGTGKVEHADIATSKIAHRIVRNMGEALLDDGFLFRDGYLFYGQL